MKNYRQKVQKPRTQVQWSWKPSSLWDAKRHRSSSDPTSVHVHEAGEGVMSSILIVFIAHSTLRGNNTYSSDPTPVVPATWSYKYIWDSEMINCILNVFISHSGPEWPIRQFTQTRQLEQQLLYRPVLLGRFLQNVSTNIHSISLKKSLDW